MTGPEPGTPTSGNINIAETGAVLSIAFSELPQAFLFEEARLIAPPGKGDIHSPVGAFGAGVTPVWASEIEPFPIRVTTKRFPSMKHYGDISQMDGGKIEPVDIIRKQALFFPLLSANSHRLFFLKKLG